MAEHRDRPLLNKHQATFMVPTELLEDFADTGDLLARALRGEIEFKPPPEPKRHRCLVCRLVSLLPGHSRCDHGRTACDDCFYGD